MDQIVIINDQSDLEFSTFLKSKLIIWQGVKINMDDVLGIGGESIDAVFRTDPLLYQKFENTVIFRPGNLSSVAQETRSVRKYLIFNFFLSKKVEINIVKVVFLFQLVAIINASSFFEEIIIF